MPSINPYLNFRGNTEEAFNFYRSVFGGEFIALKRFGETPGADQLLPEEQNKIMHVSLAIGKECMIMATDALESMGHTIIPGNNFHITINTDSQVEADQLYHGLSAGGITTMPIQETFWGAYFGMLTDRFGIQWMISFDTGKES